ncbi:heavy metal translocating P-type ATPase metal-binding domain-containing protein [Winogradskyella sp.]|uniref:heavy metal translocating P-type ATPase metal-binding domain-containing protein n=1 Tax=Winogradskyella sp. TaxID=1883156 RepID=UPI0035C85417
MDDKSYFHCGDDFGKIQIVFQEKSFCCNGCKTIVEIFSVNKLTCYLIYKIHLEQSQKKSKHLTHKKTPTLIRHWCCY